MRIKRIIIIAYHAIHPITYIKAEFKRTDIVLMCILLHFHSVDHIFMSYYIIHRFIHAVIMSFGIRAGCRIAFRSRLRFKKTYLILGRYRDCLKIQSFIS